MATENNEIKKGGISVDTEHIFPIIKKWLYSDHDIFARELVSNGCDAIYLGMQRFGARAYSASFDVESLKEAITYENAAKVTPNSYIKKYGETNAVKRKYDELLKGSKGSLN